MTVYYIYHFPAAEVIPKLNMQLFLLDLIIFCE